MRQTRRRNEYQRAQGAQRTALPFVRVEAPVGGWNTRDSEDNVPATDALEFDNWWPDIGEVRTRPGYTKHCDLRDVTTGANLLAALNPGFETAGGGGAGVFANWIETSSGSATVVDETSIYHAGAHSAMPIATGDGTSTAEVSQTIVVTASTPYVFSFWYYDNFEGQVTSSYSIYDDDNSAYITADVYITGTDTDEWIEIQSAFNTPVGCTHVILRLIAGVHLSVKSVPVYFDDVALYQLTETLGPIETLAEYISGTDRDLLAFMGGEGYDVTTSVPAHLTSAIAALTNARFQWVNFDGKLGLINGAETLVYDNVNVPSLTTYAGYNPVGVPTSIALSGGIGNPIGVNVFKNRVWYWEENSQDVWYTGLNALGGPCTEFKLSRVGQFGGNLILMETWTRDGGSGPDDFAVFVMSSGEAIVYQGSDPSAVGDWALVGIYNIGEPLSYRSSAKFGGDLYIITKLDVVRMSEVLQGVEARQMETKIVPSHRTAVNLYEANWGWQAVMYPKGHMAIFNIPVSTNTRMEQHVQNTITGAWARFKDIVANTWQLFDGEMYFGSGTTKMTAKAGVVYKFDSGEIDSDDSIESTFQTAWMPIGGTGANKLFKAVREAYKANADVTVNNSFATDFRAFTAQNFPVGVDSLGSPWDTSPWDISPWAAGDRIFNEWQTIGAYGERISMRKRLSTKQRVTVLGFDWLVERGDRL